MCAIHMLIVWHEVFDHLCMFFCYVLARQSFVSCLPFYSLESEVWQIMNGHTMCLKFCPISVHMCMCVCVCVCMCVCLCVCAFIYVCMHACINSNNCSQYILCVLVRL